MILTIYSFAPAIDTVLLYLFDAFRTHYARFMFFLLLDRLFVGIIYQGLDDANFRLTKKARSVVPDQATGFVETCITVLAGGNTVRNNLRILQILYLYTHCP